MFAFSYQKHKNKERMKLLFAVSWEQPIHWRNCEFSLQMLMFFVAFVSCFTERNCPTYMWLWTSHWNTIWWDGSGKFISLDLSMCTCVFSCIIHMSKYIICMHSSLDHAFKLRLIFTSEDPLALFSRQSMLVWNGNNVVHTHLAIIKKIHPMHPSPPTLLSYITF